MDFGDILSQWNDEQQKKKAVGKGQDGAQRSHKRANAPTAEEKEAASQGYSYEQQMAVQANKAINPMELWLRRYGTIDKDAAEDEFVERTKTENRAYMRDLRPEARIDLHGLTRTEAWNRLDSFIKACQERGMRKVLIIHGKGNHSPGSDPVLGELVRTFVEQDKRLGASGHPSRKQGGDGATWVAIKI